MNPRAAAISRLPFVYQLAVTSLDEGRSADEIGARLGIDASAVPALIELATTKLARAIDDARPRGDFAKAITTVERSKMKRSRS
jgi:DNA-directed RNA polymerase specialized sigma24 family protein